MARVTSHDIRDSHVRRILPIVGNLPSAPLMVSQKDNTYPVTKRFTFAVRLVINSIGQSPLYP